MLPIAVCHRCEHRQKDCAGPCSCKIDGRDIIEHAREGKCPIERFDLSAEELAKMYPPPVSDLPEKHAGPGDLIAWVAKHAGGCALARLYTHITGESCGCEERREKVNAWWEGVKARLRA